MAKKKTTKKKTTKSKPKKLLTIVNVILDESGSMGCCQESTISGFNECLETLRKDAKNDIRFTLTKFNTETNVVLPSIKLKDVPELTNVNYTPNGMTALYDAIGKTIATVDNAAKNDPKLKKARMLVVIITDGEENSSKEFDQKKIFNLIDEKKKGNWTFVFLGADQDAYAAGCLLGIDKGNTLSYNSTQTKQMFRSVAVSSNAYLSSKEVKTSGFIVPDQQGS